ncbi:MAG: TRIC cation channel family protein, partial [Hyphomicrobiales bacterium]|nr:TRIC cation channel family protein [Hyphomicrobiales bacterium]
MIAAAPAPETVAALTGALDLFGVAVFAASGALEAARKRMDLFGFALMACVTGVGGGTLRDLLLGAPVAWVAAPATLGVCVGVAAIAFVAA